MIEETTEEFGENKARDAVEKFWKKMDSETKKGATTYSFQISKSNRQVISGGPCHAAFNRMHNPFWISSMFITNSSNKEVADLFWEWATGEESPWKVFLQNIEPLFDANGQRIAWIIPGADQEKAQHFHHIKNFAIACRTLTEWPDAYRFWKRCVDNGLSGADAFFLCTYYDLSDHGMTSYNDGRHWGGHWPMTKDHTNLDTLRRGNYKIKEDDYRINIGWQPPHTTNINNLPKHGEKILTKFSSIESIELDEIKGVFNNWKKELKL